MPRVTAYGQPRVENRPLPSGRRTVTPSPEAFGAGFGETVARIGTQKYAQVVQEEQQRADDIANLTTTRQFNELDQQLLHSPDKGMLNKYGLSAYQSIEESQRLWDEQAGMIAGNLKSDAQRTFYEQQKIQRRGAFQRQSSDHAFAQLRTYDNEETEKFLVSSVQSAITADPVAMADHLSNAEVALTQFAARNGRGPEFKQAEIAKLRSTVYSGVVEKHLAAGNDRLAQAVYTEHKADILGSQQVDLERKLDVASTDGLALRTSIDLWATLGPKTDTDPINLDAMEDAARERFVDDPKALKATQQFLRERKTAVDASRTDRDQATAGAVWTKVNDGASLPEIKRMPEYLALPGRVQVQVVDYVVGLADREASRVATLESRAAAREGRAYALESREAARESRAYTREVRRENELEIDGWARYQELTTPTALRGLTRNAIIAELPNIGRQNVNRLLNEWEQRTKDDATLRKMEIDTDLFKELANDAGLTYVYRTPGQLTREQKATLGKLQATVNDAVAQRALAATRPLTPAEQREVMQSVIDQKVMISDWGYDTQLPAAMVNAADRAKAYVPMDQIPPQAVQEYTNYLRGEPAVTDAVRSQRFERAYALRLLGASRAEIEAALRGR